MIMMARDVRADRIARGCAECAPVEYEAVYAFVIALPPGMPENLATMVTCIAITRSLETGTPLSDWEVTQ